MSAPSSPCSMCSTLLEFKADPNVVNMLVKILTSRHGVLHYHGQTGELATFQWPTTKFGHKIHPSRFALYREVHNFRYPCCLCATGGRYVEASIFQQLEVYIKGKPTYRLCIILGGTTIDGLKWATHYQYLVLSLKDTSTPHVRTFAHSKVRQGHCGSLLR
ncbi:uncharacterized protein HD556DRAFT_1308593 [Suillus plorans]|uniref:Uncharacterized protein n=1 Tax=Suillus plorans TaxID=116603 RepID=A0A9P7AP77_9AGAM|nr:uncharacterized protein HD556DRAFT_1308593 [Suillus plorans]KAG1793447.1 hypothetical protein HD556DRAFT_1308593 [Suillus plorans]